MNSIKLFQDRKIRSVWNDEEEQWYFVLEDVISALTDSADSKQYIKRQKMNCANVRGLFRIVQSIPSPKAEPFKLWLAQVGYDRVMEIENLVSE